MIPQRLQEGQYIFFLSTEVVRVCIYLSDKTTETLNMNRKNNVDKTNFHSIDPHRKIKWFIKFFQCKESHLSSGCSPVQIGSHICAVNNFISVRSIKFFFFNSSAPQPTLVWLSGGSLRDWCKEIWKNILYHRVTTDLLKSSNLLAFFSNRSFLTKKFLSISIFYSSFNMTKICKAKSLLIPQDKTCYIRKYLCCNLSGYSQHKQKLWSALPALKPICYAYDKSYSFGSTNLHLQTAKSRGYDIAE